MKKTLGVVAAAMGLHSPVGCIVVAIGSPMVRSSSLGGRVQRNRVDGWLSVRHSALAFVRAGCRTGEQSAVRGSRCRQWS